MKLPQFYWNKSEAGDQFANAWAICNGVLPVIPFGAGLGLGFMFVEIFGGGAWSFVPGAFTGLFLTYGLPCLWGWGLRVRLT